MIQRTVEEQERALFWHRRKQLQEGAQRAGSAGSGAWRGDVLPQKDKPRQLMRETDELLYWLEECLLQNVRLVPGWLMPRIVQVLQHTDHELRDEVGRDRRPDIVMDILFRAQEVLMEELNRSRGHSAKIIDLFPTD